MFLMMAPWALLLLFVGIMTLAATPTRDEPGTSALEYLADRYAHHAGRAVLVLFVAVPGALCEILSECARRFVPAVRWQYHNFIHRLSRNAPAPFEE